MSRYSVTAVRWSGGWELHIEGEGVTQAPRLELAERQVRDYLESVHGGSFADARVDVKLAEGQRFTVTAQRSDGWWALQCVEEPGAIS